MKRETALRMANLVRERIAGSCGLIGTPGCDHEAVRIKRAWIFGSTVKGSDAPNDLDVLLDIESCGRRFLVGKGAARDKPYYKTYRISCPKESTREAFKHITGSMKMLRLHKFSIDGELAYPRVMIYPRNDLKV